MTVTIYGDFPTNVDVSVGKCAIDNPTIGDLSATGAIDPDTGITVGIIEWYDAQTGGNLLLLSQLLENGKTYWVQQTENDCTSERLPTTVELVDPPKPTVDITQSFCYPPIATVGDLKPSGTSVLWYASDISTTPLRNSTPLKHGTEYWVAAVAFPCVSTVRAKTTVFLEEAPNAGGGGSYSDCEINLVDTDLLTRLTSPDTGGTWTAPDGSTHSGTFVAGTDIAGAYTYTVAGGTICPEDTAIVTVAITVIPAPIITDADQSFCVVDLASYPTLAELTVDTIGAGNTVRWYVDETSTEVLDPTTTTLENNTTYFASQFDTASNCESATRDSKTALIEIAPNAGEDGSYSDCEINLVDTDLLTRLTSPDTGGTWTAPDGSAHSGTFVAGTDIAGAYTYTVAGGTICPEDTAIVTVAITVIPAPIITDADQSFCVVDLASYPTLAELTVDTIGAGNTVRWYVDETSTEVLDPTTTTLENNTTYFASQFDTASNCESVTRDSKTALIEIAPNAGEDGSYSDCEINLVDTDLLTRLTSPDTGGTWTAPDGSAHSGTFVAGTDVAGVYTYSVGGPICTPDTAIVTVTITVVPAPSITNNNPSFCIIDTKTVGDLVVDDATVTITWYDAATGGKVLDPATVLTTSSLWASQTDATDCESVNRTQVNVTIIDLQTPTTTANQTFCLVNNPTVASLVATGTNVLWFENETDDVSLALDPALLLVDNKIYWAADVDSTVGCESPGRVSMVVTLNDVAPVTIANVSQTFCESDFPTVENLEPSGTSIIWYASETDPTPLDITSPLIDGEYWAVQSNTTTGCESSVRVVANVTLTAIATPTLISLGNEFCIIDKPTVADLDLNVSANNGGTISWYDSYPDGNPLSSSIALTEGEIYYAIETDVNGCKSINPLEVTVTLEACDAYDVEIYDGFSPTGNGVNDTFKITNLRELYPNFKVEFFNRWGNLVYTASAAKSDWNGRLNGDGELSATGVYYFVIYFNKNDRKPIQRSLYLSR